MAYNNLLRFINEYTVDKGAACTHTTMCSNKRAFYLMVEVQDKFYDLCKASFLDKSISNLCIVEQHRLMSPVIIDLDFRQNVNNVVYNISHIETIVKNVISILETMIVLKEETDIYILTKPTRPVQGKVNTFKDGIHIVIPDIVTCNKIQYKLRTTFLEQYKNCFQDIHPFLNDAADIYDESVIERNGWIMYGCKKDDDIRPWLVQYKITYKNKTLTTETISESDAWNPDYIKLLSIRNKFESSEHTPYGQEVVSKGLIEPIKQHVEPSTNNTFKTNINTRYPSDFIKACVDNLDPKRAENYNDWIRVGWCLHNIDPNNLLNVWIEFSQQSPKFKNGECEKIWSDMKKGDLKIGSLFSWVQQDKGPQKLIELQQANKHHVLIQSISGTHVDIANVIYNMYRDTFICASIEHGQWYEYQQHRWVAIEKAYTLRRKISDEIFQEYVELAKQFQDRAVASCSQDETQALAEKVKEIQIIAKNLKNNRFKEAIVKECAELFYDPHFLNKLDENKYLLGFDNGVYDLETLEFRDGKHDDYISMSTGYEFCDQDNSEIQEYIMNFITSIMPNDDLVQYIIKVLAYSLVGEKYMECLWFFTGRGRNGKGTLMRLLQFALGQYYYEPDICMVTTSKKSSSGVSPEVAKAKGKRVLVSSEPDDSDEQSKFRANKLKQLRGNDMIQARALYKNNIEFIPQFSMIFQMNDIPDITKADDAIAKSLKIVTFPYQFIENPMLDHQRKVDPTLKAKFSTLQYYQQFMLILIKYYKRYIHGHKMLEEPDQVTVATREYIEDNDPLLQWFTTHIEVTNSTSDRLKAEEMLYAYNLGSGVKLTSQKFGKAMSAMGYKSKSSNNIRYFYGMKIKDI